MLRQLGRAVGEGLLIRWSSGGTTFSIIGFLQVVLGTIVWIILSLTSQ